MIYDLNSLTVIGDKNTEKAEKSQVLCQTG